MSISAPADGVVVLSISGHDVGEFGPAPMQALARHLREDRPVALYIDARETQGASIEVSSDWAQWLKKHRPRLKNIDMLPGSRFVEITAGFVREFSGLKDIMRVHADPRSFDDALQTAISSANR